jgi:hypothetical protein
VDEGGLGNLSIEGHTRDAARATSGPATGPATGATSGATSWAAALVSSRF